jgi:propanol-preferring alcohol dehydrogenase
MVLERVGQPLRGVEREVPRPAPDQVLVEVSACAVCRTDLHVFDGELPDPALPLVLGHEIVGRVAELGAGVRELGASGLSVGDRVGIPWLAWTCGRCGYCRTGRENLCERARFTGYQVDGGYAEHTLADPRFCLPLSFDSSDAETAPLLCAGLIGYRAYRMAQRSLESGEPIRRLGLYGFGAAAHLLCQLARAEGCEVHAFTRPGDGAAQAFARELGASWTGGSDEAPPSPLDAAILFAPVGSLVPRALAAVRRGGAVVCAGIHMSPIPELPYELLWGERIVRSVANLTRRDGREYFEALGETPVRSRVETLPLEAANEALTRLRTGEVDGALVLEP